MSIPFILARIKSKKEMVTIICPKCLTKTTGKLKVSFTGLKRIKCQSCGNTIKSPLTWGMRIVYILNSTKNGLDNGVHLKSGFVPKVDFGLDAPSPGLDLREVLPEPSIHSLVITGIREIILSLQPLVECFRAPLPG